MNPGWQPDWQPRQPWVSKTRLNSSCVQCSAGLGHGTVRKAPCYGGLLASKDKYGGLLASKYQITINIRITINENNYSYVHIVINYVHIMTNLSSDSQLTAYLRQTTHIISNYLNIMSNYVHMIVIMSLSCCFQRLTCVKST